MNTLQNNAVVFAPIIVGGTSTPTTTTPVSKGTPTTTTTMLGNTGDSSTTPTGPQAPSTAHSDVQLEGTPFKE